MAYQTMIIAQIHVYLTKHSDYITYCLINAGL